MEIKTRTTISVRSANPFAENTHVPLPVQHILSRSAKKELNAASFIIRLSDLIILLIPFNIVHSRMNNPGWSLRGKIIEWYTWGLEIHCSKSVSMHVGLPVLTTPGGVLERQRHHCCIANK